MYAAQYYINPHIQLLLLPSNDNDESNYFLSPTLVHLLRPTEIFLSSLLTSPIASINEDCNAHDDSILSDQLKLLRNCLLSVSSETLSLLPAAVAVIDFGCDVVVRLGHKVSYSYQFPLKTSASGNRLISN